MKLKSLFRYIIYSNYIFVLPAILILFALICTVSGTHNCQYSELNFTQNFNNYSSAFLVQMPLILCFLIPVYSKLQNELLRIRCLSHISVFYLKLKAALSISALYLAVKAIIEILFLGGNWLVSNIFYFIVIYLIQFGTVMFVSAFFLMLQELFNNTVIATLAFIFFIGVDLLFCVMPLHVNMNIDLNLFIGPMGLMMQYALYLIGRSSPVNFMYQYTYMIIKIILVILTTFLFIRLGRRDHVEHK